MEQMERALLLINDLPGIKASASLQPGTAPAGLAGGETTAVLGGAPAYGGTSQGAANAGLYAIVPSGLTSGNYRIGFVNGQLTIESPPITSNGTVDTVTGALTSVQNSINSTQLGQGNGAPWSGSATTSLGPGMGSGTLTGFVNTVLITDQTEASGR